MLAVVIVLLGGREAAVAAADALQQARDEWRDGRLKAAAILVEDYLQRRPADADARLLLARIDLDLWQGRAAENELTRAGRAGAEREVLLKPLARALLLQGEPQRVLDEIPVGSGDPGRQAALTALRGEAQRRLGQSRDATASFEQALALDPDQETALVGLARIALAERRLDDGRALLQRATQAAPLESAPWELLSELDYATGDFEAAEASLIKAEIVARNKAMPRFKRAMTRFELGQLDKAEADIEQVAASFPDFPGLELARGALALRRGNAAGAVGHLSGFLKRAPENLRATYLLGLAEMQRGDYELAEGYLVRYLSALPQSARAAMVLAQVRLARHDSFGAEEVLLPFADDPDAPPEVFAALSRALARQGRLGEAERRIAEAVARAPDNADYRVTHAERLAQLGRADAAGAELEAALKVDPSNRSAALLRIKGALQQGRHDEALRWARELAGERPDDASALNALGLALLGNGDVAGARAAFKQAMAARPGFPDALLNLARLALRDGDSAAARGLLEDVLADNPGHTEAVLALAQLDAADGDTPLQVERLQRAIDANPNNSRLWEALARALLSRGEPERALTHLQTVPAALKGVPELLVLRGEAELALGAGDDAIKTYQALVAALPSNAIGHYLLVRAYAAAGQDNAMRESLVRAVEIDPGDALAPSAVELVLKKVEDFPAQVQVLERLLRASDDDPRLVARKADLYLANGDHEQAEALVAGLRERYPDDSGVIRKLVEVQGAAGEADAQVATLEQWIADHPDDDPMRLMLAQAHAGRGRDAEALPLLRQLAETYPANAAILNNLAWLLRNHDPEQALRYAEHAHRLSPKDPDFLDTLGALLLERGDDERALDLLDEAHYAAPNEPTIAFHYAQALAAVERRGDARLLLRSLIQRPFPEQEAARQLLAELSN